MYVMADIDPSAQTPDPARDGIYRAIQWLLFLDVVLGGGLALVGSAVLEVDAVAYTGLGLAVVGLVLMVFFRFLAQREAAGREAERASDDRLRRAAGSEDPGGA